MTLEMDKKYVGQHTGQQAVGSFFVGASSSETSQWTRVDMGFKPRTIELVRASTNSSGFGKRLVWNQGMYVGDDSTTRAGTPGSSERSDDYHCFVMSSAGAPAKIPCFFPNTSQGDYDSLAAGSTWFQSSGYAGVLVDETGFWVGCSSSGILGERHESTGVPARPIVSFFVTG